MGTFVSKIFIKDLFRFSVQKKFKVAYILYQRGHWTVQSIFFSRFDYLVKEIYWLRLKQAQQFEENLIEGRILWLSNRSRDFFSWLNRSADN